MNRAEYQTQLNRLAATFGPASYQGDRMELIWREVNSLPLEAFRRVVDTLIGEYRQAPLLPEIRKEVSIARERLAAKQKAFNSKEAEDAYSKLLSDSEIKHYFSEVRRRMKGAMSDTDFSSMIHIMSGVAGSK